MRPQKGPSRVKGNFHARFLGGRGRANRLRLPGAAMRYLWLLVLVLVVGCDRHDAERTKLDSLLSSGQITQIEFVSPWQRNTNILTGDGARVVLGMLAASNRLYGAVDHKSRSGRIILCEASRCTPLTYWFDQRVISFRGYQFKLRGTNDVEKLFL